MYAILLCHINADIYDEIQAKSHKTTLKVSKNQAKITKRCVDGRRIGHINAS